MNDVTSQYVHVAQTAYVPTSQTTHVPGVSHESGFTLFAPQYIFLTPVPIAQYEVHDVAISATFTSQKQVKFLKLVKLMELLYQNIPLIL